MNNTQGEINASEAIRLRRSIRKFKPGASVSEKEVRVLLEAAMMAPSACNTRPWEFIVVRDREKLNELSVAHPYAGMLKTASLAIIVCAVPDAQNDDVSSKYFPQDCAAATQNILIQAVALGFGSCWCGVYPKEQRIAETREVLGISGRQGIIPFNIIAIGVPDCCPDARGFYDESKVTFI